MGLLERWRRGRSPSGAADGGPAEERGRDSAHLAEFAATHLGVEAYLEHPTPVTPRTLVLVAIDGEWTRRRVPDVRAAEEFARRAGIALHDVNLTGYPGVMRQWTARRRAQAEGRSPRGGQGGPALS